MDSGELHRLRDLGPRQQLAAAAIVGLLVLIPLVAVAINAGRWEPQADDALIELRAHDIGTSRTPLVGQPSTSGSYGEQAENVAHPGPIGFAVLAPGTRLLGPVVGTLGSAALVTAVSMVAVAWLLFRHLGPRGGAAGAVLVGLAAFSAGASGLVDPLSSNFGRMPLLAASVGVWALLCGDLRVAPLTVAFWSFAAQQHLSVLPAAAVVAGAGLAGVAWALWRTEPTERLRAAGWVVGAVVVGLMLWLPVLAQEQRNDPGNLTALSQYSGDPERIDLGLTSAFGQVATVLGPRPFLGWSNPTGWDLVQHRSALGVVATFAVVLVAMVAGAWWRRKEPKLVAAVVMVGVLAVAGLVTGMNIPDSTEQGRLNFFHWAFALSFFELLVFGWLLARLIPKLTPNLTHGRALTAVVAAAAVLVGVAVAPVVLDRTDDRLIQPLPASAVSEFVAQVTDSAVVTERDEPPLVVAYGNDRFIQFADTVGVRLIAEGTEVRFPTASAGFVHPDRIVDPCNVQEALVVSLLFDGEPEPVGTEIARVDAAPDLDRDALARLEAQALGQPMELGDDLLDALGDLPGGQGELRATFIDFRLNSAPRRVLLDRSLLDLLIDHPPASPLLDREDLISLRDSMPDGAESVPATEITAHLVDVEELRVLRPELFGACPG